MKPKIVIGVLVIIAALVYLVVGGFKDTAVYYMTVKELYADQSMPVGEGVRISGYVVPETINWDAENIKLSFAMAEEQDTLNVEYSGIMPDQLAEAQQIVVEGKLESGKLLQANNILLKCPSKYEVKETEKTNRGY
jgi:cytochrome c-type biogenesis protein CcmE